MHEARRGRHPDLGRHQVAGAVVPGAPAPQRAAPPGRPARAAPLFLLAGVSRLVQGGAGRVRDPQRPVRLRSAEGVEGAGAGQVPEAGAVVGHHRRRAGRRQAPVEPVDVPLAGGLPQHWCRRDADPAEGAGHRECFRHVAHHDGDPPTGLAAGDVVVGEDVAERALARAHHAHHVQQAADVQGRSRREPVLLPDEQFDAGQPVRPLAAARFRDLGLLFGLVHRPRGLLELVPGHRGRLALRGRPGGQVVRRGRRSACQLGRDGDREVAVPDREPVLACLRERDVPAGELRRGGEQLLELPEPRGGAGRGPVHRDGVGAVEQVAAQFLRDAGVLIQEGEPDPAAAHRPQVVPGAADRQPLFRAARVARRLRVGVAAEQRPRVPGGPAGQHPRQEVEAQLDAEHRRRREVPGQVRRPRVGELPGQGALPAVGAAHGYRPPFSVASAARRACRLACFTRSASVQISTSRRRPGSSACAKARL